MAPVSPVTQNDDSTLSSYAQCLRAGKVLLQMPGFEEITVLQSVASPRLDLTPLNKAALEISAIPSRTLAEPDPILEKTFFNCFVHNLRRNGEYVEHQPEGMSGVENHQLIRFTRKAPTP